ncbi:flavin reductase family protein [Thalassobaculum sp. OXR-137]|uniref:flavin reductase family protein n=1 Tax=Thalassobaculum sp. OXR-137 TaxID=3100173 RepID=UPI002AC8F769|nr:flavin reductase family protein [Thalassobaculum sp. OXR-137]WPZ36598.1 flavin reductase family protein [Thalassobaculum sp. OXR-137]
MHYAPATEPCPLPFSPFKSCTVPRPIGWLSTVSTEGVPNLAPYSQWQNLTFDPPMVMFAANQLSDGRRKDTVINAEQTGWFVWNMATYDLREAVNITAMELPSEVDEFERAGVTKAPCIDAPGPRVAESPAHFECRYLSTHRLQGRSSHGWVDVVYGEVMRIHVDDAVVMPDGKMDIARIRPLARLGYYDYTSVTEVFEMRIPGASGAAVDGLEGRTR